MPAAWGLKRYLFISVVCLSLTLFSIPLHQRVTAAAQAGRPLLATRVDGVNVTQDVSLDLVLPLGFTLSGSVRSADGLPVFFGFVRARSDQGSFTGSIIFTGLTSAYRLVLPGGTYRLSVIAGLIDLNSEDSAPIFMATEIPQTVTVTGNQTFDLTVPGLPTTYQISGRITGAGTLPTRGAIQFRSTDQTILGSTDFDPEYRLRLPAGTYQVAVSFGVDERESLSMRVGEVTVNGPGTFDIRLPDTVTLSGTVKRADGEPATPAEVLAFDADELSSVGDPDEGPFTPALFVTGGIASIPEQSTTGDYTLSVPPGSYAVASIADIDLGEGVGGQLTFPFPFLELNLVTDTTHDFRLPPLPSTAIISGTVTDENGQPVAQALVSASTESIMNAPDARFSSSTLTNEMGRYTLTVLHGSDYTVAVTPPQEPEPFAAAPQHRRDLVGSWSRPKK
ncbi:MAG: carboxypeptidase regulatory-like domain-containing protein [Acidobacteria bacterium]|nr:MAG: carboxypeptidase regulatory-like domain-containing protein [Acidobacteriota bacterium]